MEFQRNLTPVKFAPARLGLLLLGERLVAAVVDGGRVEAFTVEAENPAASLRAELEQRKVSPRTVALGLPRGSVTVKPIDLPAVDGEVGEMVRFELDRHLPYASDDPAFDFVLLPQETAPGGPAPRRVVIAAADRRVIDGALRIAEDAKLRPVSITVAAHNLPALAMRQRRGRLLWIHRVGDTAELLFLNGGTLVMSRHLQSADDARVVAEAQLSFGVTRWNGCDAIWLSGDGVKPGTPTALTDLCPAVTEPAWTPRARSLLAALPEEGQGVLVLALAVAAARGARPLELLPVPLRQRRLTRGQLVTAGLAAAALVLAVVASLVPGYRENRRLADVNRQITALDQEVRTVEQVLKDVERKRRLLQTIESAETTSLRPLPVMRDLTELMPNDAWLTLLSFDLKGVELTGQANAAAALIPLLENSPRFERVEFSSPVTRGRDREQFRIRASWEGGPGRILTTASVPPPPAPSAQPVAPVAPPARGPRATVPGAPAQDPDAAVMDTPPPVRPRRSLAAPPGAPTAPR